MHGGQLPTVVEAPQQIGQLPCKQPDWQGALQGSTVLDAPAKTHTIGSMGWRTAGSNIISSSSLVILHNCQPCNTGRAAKADMHLSYRGSIIQCNQPLLPVEPTETAPLTALCLTASML
jgi:hypothetical protein